MQQKSQPLFFGLIGLAGIALILLPVGIANLVLGYGLGDSPCTSCWGQRQSMIYIGVLALFIVRYGLKPRYIALILVVTAFGLWQSFNHIAWHSGRDLDQGFSLMIFGLHTYAWAEIVFWAVVLALGLLLFFVPKFSELEIKEPFRNLSKPLKYGFFACAFVIASNVFQAFVTTGIPPYMGQGDPVRFSLNPNTIIWSANNWKKFFASYSILGKRDVKAPDYAFSPATKLNIEFDHESSHAPLTPNEELNILSQSTIQIPSPLNTLSLIDGEYIVSSKYDVYFLDSHFATLDEFKLDPYFSATIDPIVGIIPFADNYMLIGSNKTYLRFAKNPHADANLQYADFIKGANHFEGQGKNLGRGRLDTIRAKFNHISSLATDGKYFYTATTPNNKDQKSFVISKFLSQDRTLSAEFTPQAELKEGRTLGDLYITSMIYHDGFLYALSKNYNIIIQIDPSKEAITKVFSYPKTITNARGLIYNEQGIQILSYQEQSNILFTLEGCFCNPKQES